MKKIAIFGNSGSGKSTLSKEYAEKYDIPCLDLDTLAWKISDPPSRKPLEDSYLLIQKFLDAESSWVIEGCYTDLIDYVISDTSDVIFLNPGVASCLENCNSRPWEPHKYESSELQDSNLEMLLEWVKQYYVRDDNSSLKAHQLLFDNFEGNKKQFTSNRR